MPKPQLTISRSPLKAETRRDSGDFSGGDSFRFELIRKAIHLCSITIPVFYFFTPRQLALEVLIPLTLAFIAIDIARYYLGPVETWFYETFGWLLRSRERDSNRKRLNGATYVLISATLCVLIFPKLIAVTSFLILIISDLSAALIGKRFGRHRLFGKSLEGSLGFFASALIIIALLPKIEYAPAEYGIGVVAALAGAAVEALPIDVDDNISVPLTVGAALWAGYALFLPLLNVYKFG